MLLAVILTAMTPSLVIAASTSPSATIYRIYATATTHAIELDPTVSLTAAYNCTNWTGATTSTHRGYINPITDDAAKAQLSIALLALASGKKVAFSASSCYSTTGYPLIDTIYIFNQ